ncbi:MAG: hypothetical protein HY710_08860 [Candidatus Latescibacteria bacterium]|nr:hypothetical protein [Candidatus Latescibacterota bacterium]
MGRSGIWMPLNAWPMLSFFQGTDPFGSIGGKDGMSGITGLMAVILSTTCAMIICAGLVIYLLRHQKMRHQEKLAMIEKGIYLETRRQEAGVPSLAIIILVGIGLATLASNEEPFLGFALLFIGVGLIVRDRLLRHKKRTTGRLSTGPLEDKPKQQEPWQ